MNLLILLAVGGLGGLTAVLTTVVTFIRERFRRALHSDNSGKVTIIDSEGRTVKLNVQQPVNAEEVAEKLMSDYSPKPSDPGPTTLSS